MTSTEDVQFCSQLRKNCGHTENSAGQASKELKMSNIEHFSQTLMPHYAGMKSAELTLKQILSVPCSTCGAEVAEVCELHTGAPRTEPHRDRKLSAAEAVETKLAQRDRR